MPTGRASAFKRSCVLKRSECAYDPYWKTTTTLSLILSLAFITQKKPALLATKFNGFVYEKSDYTDCQVGENAFEARNSLLALEAHQEVCLEFPPGLSIRHLMVVPSIERFTLTRFHANIRGQLMG